MPSNVDDRIRGMKNLIGFYDLTRKQLAEYKKLKLAELEARRAVDNFLDSCLTVPLDPKQRVEIYRKQRGEFMSNNMGDGQDEDRLDVEVDEMSDWEFVQTFAEEVMEEE